VDVYIDASLPYPDAKVASVLCIGDPMKYEIRRGCAISYSWILSSIVPYCSLHIPTEATIVMGKVILWGMPPLIIEQIYADMLLLENNGMNHWRQWGSSKHSNKSAIGGKRQ
jgi:hypothetical protein